MPANIFEMEGKEKIREIIFKAVRTSNYGELITVVTNYQQQLIEENEIRSASNSNEASEKVDVEKEITQLLAAEYDGIGSSSKVELLLNVAVNQNSEKIVRKLQYSQIFVRLDDR